MSDVIQLAKQLISIESVTPNDNGCQQLIKNFLQPLGFDCQHLDREDVTNLWARYGNTGPLLVFSGHTDVVPPGPLEAWHSDPFNATIRNNNLYGRGAADMKSSIAAMIVAVKQFIEKTPSFNGSIAFAITSDEEGIAEHGSTAIVDWLQKNNITPDYCLIGEASCEKQFGDMIKTGRRGSLHGTLTVTGKQGHIAYPHKALNAIKLAQPMIDALYQAEWDQGCENFSPTTFDISNCHAGVGAKNVIPGELVLNFNFRFCPASTVESLQQQVANVLLPFKVHYKIEWKVGALPFYTPAGKLANAASIALKEVVGITPEISTIGGTSDGRFFAPLGCEIVELGPINASIHKINEHVNIDELQKLTHTYTKLLHSLFTDN